MRKGLLATAWEANLDYKVMLMAITKKCLERVKAQGRKQRRAIASSLPWFYEICHILDDPGVFFGITEGLPGMYRTPKLLDGTSSIVECWHHRYGTLRLAPLQENEVEGILQTRINNIPF